VDFDKKIKVNFKTVLKDLAKGLNKIKNQSILLNTIKLLQYKGNEEIIEILESYKKKPYSTKDIVDSF